MEHIDHFDVPVLHGTMVAVELKLVCLALVVALESESGVVAVFRVSVRHALHEDRWRVG